MKYPRYQKYRPSGVEWIGDVPEGWSVSRVLDRVRLINGYPFDSKLFAASLGIPLVRIRDINSLEAEVGWTGPDVPEARISNGDLLVGMDGEFNVGWWQGGPALLNQRVCCVRAHNSVEQRLLFYAMPCPLGMINDVTYSTTVKHLSSSQIGHLRFALPAPDELRAIAAFLDAKTAEIDTLIAKKESLVQLLEEKRAALIAHAVTKGLDPKAPMKESGSPWVGRVPEHWRYARVAYVADVFNGSTPDRDNPDYWEQGDVPWLSSGKVNDGTVTEADEFVTQKALRECSIRRMPAGSVLVGMIGQGKTRGMSAFMEMSACINQNVAAVVPRAGTNGRFLHFVFKAAYLPLREFGRGGQQDALNCDLIKAFRIPIPPAPEQEQIARYLGQKTAWVDELSSKVCLAIDRLREYRTALISAAVTGKIDIRNLTPTAPCQ